MGRTDVRDDDGADSRDDDRTNTSDDRPATNDRPNTNGDQAADAASYSEPIQNALDSLRAGEPICVHDFGDREGETDLFYPALAVDADAVARLRTDAGGLVCVALGDAVAAAADLPLFADAVEHPAVETANLAYGDRSSFSLTVNHRDTYTGITDADRALTISELGAFAAAVDSGEFTAAVDGDEFTAGFGGGEVAAPRNAFADEFRVPGHVHLLRAARGGLGERRGHTELAIALAEAAGLPPAVVVCEMLDDESGEALSLDDAREYASQTDAPFLTGTEIVEELS